MDRRDMRGRTYRKRSRRGLEERVGLLEERVERLEAAVRLKERVGADERSCCDDLIGCLDDCVTDVRQLRQRVRNVRS